MGTNEETNFGVTIGYRHNVIDHFKFVLSNIMEKQVKKIFFTI